MPTLTIKRSKAASTSRKGKAAKTAVSRTHRAVKPVAKKPDMKAWAAFALARLKKQYGERIVADSASMLEDMRADRF